MNIVTTEAECVSQPAMLHPVAFTRPDRDGDNAGDLTCSGAMAGIKGCYRRQGQRLVDC